MKVSKYDWAENLQPNTRRQMIDILTTGLDLTNQLKTELDQNEHNGLVSGDLVSGISYSFTTSLSMLDMSTSTNYLTNTRNNINTSYTTTRTSLDNSDEGSKFPATAHVASGGRKSVEAGEVNSRSSAHHQVKDKRGCYRRRRTIETRELITENLVDDHHQWRKYGQKNIQHSDFPRNYFRCTHKFEQKCQATKQVQQIQEHPHKYHIIYYGDHTCKKVDDYQYYLDESNRIESSNVLCFNTNNQQEFDRSSSFFANCFQLPSTKPEVNDIYNNKIQCLSSFSDQDDRQSFTFEQVITGANSSCTTSTTTGDGDLDLDLDMINDFCQDWL